MGNPDSRRRLGITLGDPAGVGPEIVVRALAALANDALANLVVYGHRELLARAAAVTGVALAADLAVIEVGPCPATMAGKPDDEGGAAQVAYLTAACDACERGELAGLVTAPISKTWVRRAGFAFPGHTEYLAARFGRREVVMMFAGPRMKVALATVHVPLADVPRTLTRERLLGVVDEFRRALREDFGIAAPRVGVVGMNPHAGEGGLLGRDELDVIAPAVASRAADGVIGPLVPDAAFRDHLEGQTDGVVAMYHDQGLIPVKLIDFDDAVNVTLGLSIIRTSPDHGTAYDVAGRGVARATSFAAALRLASELVARRAAAAQ